MKIKGADVKDRLARAGKFLYLKLFRINDTPERIAFGLGLGVFFGVMPFMGPFTALFAAILLKANRAAAFLGGLVTNTWMSIPLFLIAVKTGSVLTGTSYAYLHDQWHVFLRDFRLSLLLKVSVYKLIIPVLTGYVAVSLVIGLLAYMVALIILKYREKRSGKRMRIPTVLICSAFVFLAFNPLCFSEDTGYSQEIRMTRGVVISRDYTSSTLVVNYIRYHVPQGVKVYKGSSTLGFLSLNINDPVIIKYYQDSSGAYIVNDITVEYYGDFPI